LVSTLFLCKTYDEGVGGKLLSLFFWFFMELGIFPCFLYLVVFFSKKKKQKQNYGADFPVFVMG